MHKCFSFPDVCSCVFSIYEKNSLSLKLNNFHIFSNSWYSLNLFCTKNYFSWTCYYFCPLLYANLWCNLHFSNIFLSLRHSLTALFKITTLNTYYLQSCSIFNQKYLLLPNHVIVYIYIFCNLVYFSLPPTRTGSPVILFRVQWLRP